MKDPQATNRSITGGIPFISVTLHCLAMPVLVFLRRNFGYTYLGPKKIFFALMFACSLFSYAVWHDEKLRHALLLPATFGLAASSLYLIHLTLSLVKQGRSRAEHDQDSGTSHLLALWRSTKSHGFESILHCAIEPAFVSIIGFAVKPSVLGSLLLLSGSSLALKEWIRWWLVLRLKKRNKDNRADATELMDEVGPGASPALTRLGRTGRERLERNFTDAPSTGD